jgi:hypothetical protein
VVEAIGRSTLLSRTRTKGGLQSLGLPVPTLYSEGSAQLNWTKEDDAALLAAIAKARTVPEAIDLARIALPRRALTYDVIGNRLRRTGRPTLGALIQPDTPPPPPERVRETITHLDEHRLKVQLRNEKARSESLARELLSTKGALDAISHATSQPLPRV